MHLPRQPARPSDSHGGSHRGSHRGAHGARTIRPHTVLLVLLVAASASACATFGLGGPEYDVGGAWEGNVNVQGQAIPGTLNLVQEGHLLDATFRAPAFDLDASGAGEVDDEGAFWFELAYDMECPGTARLEGTVAEERDRLSGTLEATDCTGTVRGTFRFTR